MTDLRKIPQEDLLEELERREKESIPKPLDNINIEAIKNIAREELEYVTENGENSKDIEHWMYETLMKSVYGDDVFDYLNSKIN